jgi:hypothetical protein
VRSGLQQSAAFTRWAGLLAVCIFGLTAWTRAASIASNPPGPDGLGLNIHFTDPLPGEMQMLTDTGVRWIRMDFIWAETEKSPGRYDFTKYDPLIAALNQYHLHAILILDYGNNLYDDGLAPHTDRGRQAFAQWAAAGVRRFRGAPVLWEMWKEPNGGFWRPRANVENYIRLAQEVGEAIKQADPQALYIGPASAGIAQRDTHVPNSFLEDCLKAGMLRYWSAVSVHPYRTGDPETVAADYQGLREMIAQYAPSGRQIPILCGEWGYSSASKRTGEDRQAKLLARLWLTNLANDIPISIWYDWHDDGPRALDLEHHFGIVSFPYEAGHSPVYAPKPAFFAARTLTHVLNGYTFQKRLAVGGANDYVLVFEKDGAERLVAWTTDRTPHTLRVPTVHPQWSVIGCEGNDLAPITAMNGTVEVSVGDAPVYLVPRD